MERAEYALMDEAEDRMWWYRALHARLLGAIMSVTGRLLDAGCGTGGLLSRIRGTRDDLDLHGIEFDAPAAARAREKSGARIVRGSVNELPYHSGTFDIVVAVDVLCHAAVVPSVAVAEFVRVLRDGGLLVVNMPAFAWLASSHDRRVHNARRQNAEELHDSLASAGLAMVRTEYWNGLLLPLMVVERKLRARGKDAASGVVAFPRWLDATFHAVTAVERRLPFRMPAGGSVMATAIKAPA